MEMKNRLSFAIIFGATLSVVTSSQSAKSDVINQYSVGRVSDFQSSEVIANYTLDSWKPSEPMSSRVCQIWKIENQLTVVASAFGFNPVIPVGSSTVILKSNATEDLLIQAYVYSRNPGVLHGNFLAPTFLEDTKFPDTVADGYDFDSVALVKPGETIAINIPAHTNPTSGIESYLNLNCQPAIEFVNDKIHRFRYGGEARFDIRN